MSYDNEYLIQKRAEYTEKLMPLFAYIPYLKEHEGVNTRSLYEGDENTRLTSVPVPVFDGTVLRFVKEAQKTGLIDRNYIYAYNKIGAKTPKDERLYISGATFRDIDTVIAVMAKYVILGMSKGTMWSTAVEEGVWYHALVKIKELIEMYDGPLA